MKGHKKTPCSAQQAEQGTRTNLTTRYCVRAYCSTEERKRQDAKATTVNATAK